MHTGTCLSRPKQCGVFTVGCGRVGCLPIAYLRLGPLAKSAVLDMDVAGVARLFLLGGLRSLIYIGRRQVFTVLLLRPS